LNRYVDSRQDQASKFDERFKRAASSGTFRKNIATATKARPAKSATLSAFRQKKSAPVKMVTEDVEEQE